MSTLSPPARVNKPPPVPIRRLCPQHDSEPCVCYNDREHSFEPESENPADYS